MESKTIRFRMKNMGDGRYLNHDGPIEVSLLVSYDAFRVDGCWSDFLDIVITPVASPEERLREARLVALRDVGFDTVAACVDIIERVDAEFAKSTPRE